MNNQQDWKADRVNSNECLHVNGWMINDRYLDYGCSRYVFSVIYGYSSAKNGQYCTFSVNHIAEMVGVDRRTINNIINYLLDIKYIKRVPINGKRYKYWALTEEEIEKLNNSRVFSNNGKPFPIVNNGKSFPVDEKPFHIDGNSFHINGKPFPPNINNINNNINRYIADSTESDPAKPAISRKKKRSSDPTLEEINKYIAENGLHVDGEAFYHFYAAVNWMQGRTKIRDWREKLLSWDKSNRVSKDNKTRKASDKTSFQQNTYDFEALEKDLVRN
jgi:hypothetical protein